MTSQPVLARAGAVVAQRSDWRLGLQESDGDAKACLPLSASLSLTSKMKNHSSLTASLRLFTSFCWETWHDAYKTLRFRQTRTHQAVPTVKREYYHSGKALRSEQFYCEAHHSGGFVGAGIRISSAAKTKAFVRSHQCF